jgi:hypothetical protein
MECTLLAMTTEASSKAYPLRLVQVGIVTVTMAVIRHPVLVAVLAGMVIHGQAATPPHPHQAVIPTVPIMDFHPLVMVPVVVTDPCIQPAVVDPD